MGTRMWLVWLVVGFGYLQIADSKESSVKNQGRKKVSQTETAHCHLPPKTGDCRADFPRWYYDSASVRCHRFTYGGCEGNANNYASEAECEAACMPRRIGAAEGRSVADEEEKIQEDAKSSSESTEMMEMGRDGTPELEIYQPPRLGGSQLEPLVQYVLKQQRQRMSK